MKYEKGKSGVKPASADLEDLQNLPGDDHAQTGIQQRKDLQIFESQLLAYAQKNIELQPEKGQDMVKGRMIVGEQLVGIYVRKLMEFVDILYV